MGGSELRTVLAEDGDTWIVQEPDGNLSHEIRHPDKPAEVTPLELSPELDLVREVLFDEKLTEEDKLAVFPVCESIRKGERVKAADARALESKLEAATVDDQDLLK